MRRTASTPPTRWRVRQFKEGETHETTIRFTPEGRSYGFVEKLKEDEPGAALDAGAARALAENAAPRWNVDFSKFAVAEQGQERRVGGRVDHTITYERRRRRRRRGATGCAWWCRATGSRKSRTSCAFPRRSPGATPTCAPPTTPSASGSVVGMMLLYVVGGIGVGLFFMLRARWVLWRQAAVWGIAVGVMQALAMINQLPLEWMAYDTALPRSTFLAQQAALVHRQPDRLLGVLRAVVHGGRDADAPRLRRPPAAVARVVAPIAGDARRAWRVGPDPRAHGGATCWSRCSSRTT